MKQSLSVLIARAIVLSLSLAPLCACHVSTSFGIGESSFDFGEKAQREETQPLDIKEGEVLRLESNYGDIQVVAGTSEEPSVHAVLTAHANTEEKAKEILAKTKLALIRTKDGLTLRIEDEPVDQGTGDVKVVIRTRVDFRLRIPRGVRLEMETGSGDIRAHGPSGNSQLASGYGKIEVDGLEGDLRVKSGSGDVRLSHVHGERLDAESSYGEVELEHCAIKSVVLATSSGDLRLDDVESSNMRMNSGYGDLEVKRVRGAIEAKLSSGSIDIEDASGGALKLESGYGGIRLKNCASEIAATTASGDIEVKFVRADLAAHDAQGRVDAKSGYGSIEVDGVLTQVSAVSASGSIRVRARSGSRVESAWKLASGYGDVELDLPHDIACRIAAKTGYGQVKLDLPRAVAADSTKEDEHSTHAELNGGGQVIQLESASGDVAVRAIDA